MQKICWLCKRAVESERAMVCSRCNKTVCAECGALQDNTCPNCDSQYRYYS